MDRILGLDFGNKRIGISISDPSNIFALPHAIYFRENIQKDIDHINSISESNSISKIIIGLPLSLDGQENIRTKKTREFAKKLSSSLSLDYYFQDERFSTAVVTKEMRKNSLSNKKIKKHVDHSAAAYILQGFLDKYLRNL